MGHHEIGCLNHCAGGHGGGGGGWLVIPALIVAVVVTVLGYHVRHGIETGIAIGMWVTGGVVGLIFAALITLGVVKLVRHVHARQAQQPAQPEAYQEPVHQITQMGTHRTVRGAIEAPRTQPETDPRSWLGDTDWPEQVPAPAPREAYHSRAPRQEADPENDEPRYHSRFR